MWCIALASHADLPIVLHVGAMLLSHQVRVSLHVFCLQMTWLRIDIALYHAASDVVGMGFVLLNAGDNEKLNAVIAQAVGGLSTVISRANITGGPIIADALNTLYNTLPAVNNFIDCDGVVAADALKFTAGNLANLVSLSQNTYSRGYYNQLCGAVSSYNVQFTFIPETTTAAG